MVFLLLAALVIPLGLDLYMPVPDANPITAEKIELGRRLFNDRRLSRDGTIAFATVNFDQRADALPKNAVDKVIATARSARSPRLDVQLGGQAIEQAQQASLGFDCDHCHDMPDADKDTKNKKIAREMMRMTNEINQKFLRGADVRVTCDTCHRGKEKPEAVSPAGKG